VVPLVGRDSAEQSRPARDVLSAFAKGKSNNVEVAPVVSFVSSESPLEITINFGLVAGRGAAREDVDRLGRELKLFVSSVTLFAGRRYEFAAGAAEVAADEVRARLDEAVLPAGRAERDALIERLLTTTNAWARAAAAAPPPSEGLAERFARDAAVGTSRDEAP
jgi:hypothetical protein